MKDRLLATAKLLGLTAGAVLFALLIGELILEIWAPQVHQLPLVWEYDESLGWRHRPESTGRMRTPEFDVEYQIDAGGLRVETEASQPGVSKGSTPRIALYGDSFAEGWGVEARQSLSGQLRTLLQHDHPGVSVSNLGVAGYGTDQQLLLHMQVGRRLSSQIVLVLFYGNDLWNNASRRGIGVERGGKPFFTLDSTGTLRLQGVPVRRDPAWDRDAGLMTSLLRRWHVPALLAGVLRRDEISSGQHDAYYAGLYGRDAPKYAQQWQLTCRLLSRFRDIVEAQGGFFAVVYAPAIVQIETENWERKRKRFALDGSYDLMKPNHILSGWARQQGVHFLDLYPAFLQEHLAGGRLYFKDSHWRPEGHRLAAIETRDFLRRQGWLTP
jgi:hypothetical protein